MNVQELFGEENTRIQERYDLAMERILAVPSETAVEEPYRAYFVMLAGWAAQIDELGRHCMRDELDALSLAELKQLNHSLFVDILPDHYGESYANPVFAARCLGEEMGPLLAAFYTQFRAVVVFAYECRLTDITILCETFLQIYTLFEEDVPSADSVRDVLYWFFSDYTDVTLTYRLREQLDPTLSFARDIIMESDLSDLRYLYRFGEYISESELAVASYLNSFPEETIERMARTFTEGYRRGFAVMRRDLSKKGTVAIRYELGFERMIRAAIRQFAEMGLEVILYRAAVWSVNQNVGRKTGYHSSSPNRQFEYDHRYDSAIYLDKAFQERKLGVLRTAYERYRKEAARYAGPAVVETFGEDGFEPVNHAEALAWSPKQEQIAIAYSNEAMPIVNRYIPGEETSFTIIAFPVPAIGKNFAEIFAETIRINTLDYEVYQEIQQKIIDTLDRASQVHVTGRGTNETNILVSLHPLWDITKETNFENCVADVNIPLGEVFTSPVLAGTTGLLHVGRVYLGNYSFTNLRIYLEDGMVTDYSCDNFENLEEGRKLIRQEILKNHETLPLGEFAIGTNTAAFAMAERFGIAQKLPILIAEKMGPHFAVGDTCYSWSEDSPMYNPDGREVIARDNEVSRLRREDVSKAYFGCHTDITIPYSELGDIVAVTADGCELPVIRQGRFVVPGTEKLNAELDRQC
ncbi:MAG: aminopeptidase [Clostridiales bacterium]|nr:aminopeptidase [Clostridiales bacterium]